MRRLRTVAEFAFYLSAIAFAFGCSEGGRIRVEGEEPSYTGQIFGHIVLPREVVEHEWSTFGRCRDYDTASMAPAWNVTPEIANTVIDAVSHELMQSLVGSTHNVSDYAYQLAGVRFQGTNVVLVNGVHIALFATIFRTPFVEERTLPSLWRSTPVVPCDGGLLRFSTVVDTEGRIVRPVKFNSVE